MCRFGGIDALDRWYLALTHLDHLDHDNSHSTNALLGNPLGRHCSPPMLTARLNQQTVGLRSRQLESQTNFHTSQYFTLIACILSSEQIVLR